MTLSKLLTLFATLLFASLVVNLTACSAPDDASRALKGAGYTQVTLTGYRVFGCGQDDIFHTGFSAVGPTGQQVTGVVCGGVMKGSTIRTD